MFELAEIITMYMVAKIFLRDVHGIQLPVFKGVKQKTSYLYMKSATSIQRVKSPLELVEFNFNIIA